MIIIGIAGPIGHGKTSLAQYFAGCDPQSFQGEPSAVICEIASKLNNLATTEKPRREDINTVNHWLGYLPDILFESLELMVSNEATVLHRKHVESNPEEYQKLWEYLELIQKDPTLTQQTITGDNKATFRPLLQWIGSYLVEHLDRAIWINDLLRRAEKAQANLVAISGVRYQSDADILREKGAIIVKIIRRGVAETDTTDATERERSEIIPDTTLHNNGTLADLKRCAENIYKDIRTEKLESSYSPLH